MGVDVARQTLALTTIILLSTLPLAAGPDKQAEAVPVTGVPAPELASLDELLLAFLRENEIAGASLAITKEGRLVHARGFGWADPDGQVKVSPTSLFRIASISKPITAVAILMLIERGKLKLDDKAFDLIALQPLPGRERDPRLKDITVRHLLEHTAGFDRAKSFDPMFRPVMIAKELDVPPPAQPEHIIRYMLGQPLDFDPGSRHAYSNYGYCVLGRIIERVSGQPYETFVRHEVLKPLGITRTKLGKTLERAADEVRYRDAKSRTAPAIL
jgi:CubicO group peptidase (beta-lactamase class C family)